MSVVNTLLQLATSGAKQLYIPIEIWAWLKKQPSLPPVCEGRDWGTGQNLVRFVRGIGDLNILKSYFLLVWSEWNSLFDSGFVEMQVSIVEDLGGIGMQRHRQDLIERLDHILGELDRGLEHFKQHQWWAEENDVQRRKARYRTLREALLEQTRKESKTS